MASASASLNSNEIMKEEPEAKLLPHVKLENDDLFEFCDKDHSSDHQNIKHCFILHQGVKEEPLNELIYQKDALVIIDKMKFSDIYKHNIKEEDVFADDAKLDVFAGDAKLNVSVLHKVHADDSKCNLRIIKPEVECSVDNNLSTSAYEDLHHLKNKSNDSNEVSVTGEDYKTTISSDGDKISSFLKKPENDAHKKPTNKSTASRKFYQELKAFKCCECHEVFHNLKKIICHVREVHKISKKIYECSICTKSYSEKRGLKAHVNRIHMGVKDYECVKCEKGFYNQGTLKRHFSRVHVRCQDFKCAQCHKCLFSKAELLRHLTSEHDGNQCYECSECSTVFLRKDNLKDHIYGMHSKSYQCMECTKCLYNKRGLERHIDAVHKKIKNFDCHICHKMFFRKCELQCHVISKHKCY